MANETAVKTPRKRKDAKALLVDHSKQLRQKIFAAEFPRQTEADLLDQHAKLSTAINDALNGKSKPMAAGASS